MDELVKFETSVLAKEKGFDEICSYYYDIGDSPSFVKMKNSNKDGFSEPSCPTQTTLQRWLIEKHKIIVIISFYNDGEEWEDTEYMVEVSEFKHFKTHDSFVKSEFTSYEQALEIGLQAALKLI